jgi:hypothetical protein
VPATTLTRNFARWVLAIVALAVLVVFAARKFPHYSGDGASAEGPVQSVGTSRGPLRPFEPHDTAVSSSDGEHALDRSPVNSVSLHCDLRTSDGSIEPLMDGTLWARLAGDALLAIPVLRGRCEIGSLDRAARVVELRDHEGALRILTAPENLSLGGRILAERNRLLRIHVRELLTRAPLDVVEVWWLKPTGRDSEAIPIASGSSPLHVQPLSGWLEVEVRTPHHGTSQHWVDGTAEEVTLWIAATGELEIVAPWIHSGPHGRVAPGYPNAFVQLDASTGPVRSIDAAFDPSTSSAIIRGLPTGQYDVLVRAVGLAGIGHAARTDARIVPGRVTRVTIDPPLQSPYENAVLDIVLAVPAGLATERFAVSIFWRPLNQPNESWVNAGRLRLAQMREGAPGLYGLTIPSFAPGEVLLFEESTSARARTLLEAGRTSLAMLSLEDLVEVQLVVEGERTGYGVVEWNYAGERDPPSGSASIPPDSAAIELYLIPIALDLTVEYKDAGGSLRGVRPELGSRSTWTLQLHPREGAIDCAVHLWFEGRRLHVPMRFWDQLVIRDEAGKITGERRTFGGAIGSRHTAAGSTIVDGSICIVTLKPGTYTLSLAGRLGGRRVGSFLVTPDQRMSIAELEDLTGLLPVPE